MNKQSNEKFDKLIEYIENNLCEDIDYKKLSQILGVNEYTLHRIFLFVTNYNLAEYIRKRRLSMAALDLIDGKEKIIDIAIKYNYESSQTFSRAFKNMMGFLPSEINDNKNDIKFFSRYELLYEDITDEFRYFVEKNIEFDFYAIAMKTTVQRCYKEAPQFWQDNSQYLKGKSQFGLLYYDKYVDDEEEAEATYYIASKETFENAQKLHIRKSNYLVFEFEFTGASDLNKVCCKIYRTIILNSGYELEDLPDIEEYIQGNKIKLYIPVK